jgi:lipopolysaccharide/colanic/teichoic acid biosynthesis glycosyltransferase
MTTGTYSSRQSELASAWCRSRRKRWMDILTSSLALLLLSPLFFLIALFVAITSGKPIFFRQWRLGQNSRRFQVHKFRTMRPATNIGIGVTQKGDPRITSVGHWLRRWKLDELPQLYNVLRGEMSLVGPRPDLENVWSRATAADRRILQLKPGLTGAASIAFYDEESLLANIPTERLTSFYMEQLLPQKAKLESEYAAQATFRSDCGILLQTLFVPFVPRRIMAKESDELASR